MNYGQDEEMTEAPETADTSETKSDTFYLPADMAAGLNCKPGDTLSFRVVGKDSDGNIEVEHVTGESESDDWEKDLENHMPASVGGRMEG